jgi:hypothetical protein
MDAQRYATQIRHWESCHHISFFDGFVPYNIDAKEWVAFLREKGFSEKADYAEKVFENKEYDTYFPFDVFDAITYDYFEYFGEYAVNIRRHIENMTLVVEHLLIKGLESKLIEFLNSKKDLTD